MSLDEDYGFAEISHRTCAVVISANSYKEIIKSGYAVHEKAPLFVVTHQTDLKKQSENTKFYSGDLTKLITDVKSETTKDVHIYGGGDVISQCIAADTVDEISLAIILALLGFGTPLFKQFQSSVKLKLVSNKEFNSGMVILNYVFK